MSARRTRWRGSARLSRRTSSHVRPPSPAVWDFGLWSGDPIPWVTVPVSAIGRRRLPPPVAAVLLGVLGLAACTDTTIDTTAADTAGATASAEHLTGTEEYLPGLRPTSTDHPAAARLRWSSSSPVAAGSMPIGAVGPAGRHVG